MNNYFAYFNTNSFGRTCLKNLKKSLNCCDVGYFFVSLSHG